MNIDFAAIDALFAELGYGVSSEDGDIGFTSETIEAVKVARQSYSKIGSLTDGEVDGHRYIEIRDAQIRSGQPRRTVLAIEVDGQLAIMTA